VYQVIKIYYDQIDFQKSYQIAKLSNLIRNMLYIIFLA